MTSNGQMYTETDVLRLAHEAYAHGRATFTIDVSSTALLVIDMQREFVEPGLTKYWIPEATHMVPRLAGILAAARSAHLPIIHTAFGATHHYLDRPAAGPHMPNRYPALPEADLDGEIRFTPGLEPAANEIVLLKPSYGAFYDTPLDTILRNLGRDTVIITGTLTN